MAINQYAREGNGPNAHKKGNRTRTGRNPAAAIEINKQIGQDISRYKEIAENARKARKWKQEDLAGIHERLKRHIEESSEEKPLTIGGMILASGMNKDSWYAAANGEYDYRLYEYMELHGIDAASASMTDDGIPYISVDNRVILLICYSEILQKALLMKEAEDERRLLKKGRVADIFNMKALHNWQEETSPHTVNQTLVLASPEQARDAIKMLE